MSYKQDIMEAIKLAMKSGDKDRLLVLRGVSAALKQREVDERIELTDDDVLAILDKQLKQRKDSEQQFRAAGRDDLANKELYEIGVISEFLPKQLSEEEINEAIKNAMQSIDEAGMSAMGKIVAILKPQMQGRADMSVVSKLIKEKLSKT